MRKIASKYRVVVPTEHDEAVSLARYLAILKDSGRIKLYTHLAQETYTKNWGTRMKNKVEGVKPGFPDYAIVGDKRLLFVELKRAKGSTVSEEQSKWVAFLDRLGENVCARICYGFEEAKRLIDIYFS